MAHIEAVCVSAKKGMVKKETPEAVLVTNWGIEGDAHAGDWHRQVSLLAGESIDRTKEKMPTLRKGAFAENLITRGIDLSTLKVGDRLKIDGNIILEITQIGKECHNAGCAIKKATGDCIMPKEGLFSRVIQGGTIKSDAKVELLDALAMSSGCACDGSCACNGG